MKRFLAAFLTGLVFAGVAQAQATSQLSEREQAYLSSLDLALPGAVRNTASLGAQPKKGLTRGLRAQVGDTEVQRFRFANAEAAQVFASQRTPGSMDNQPGFVEVRGNQVVVVYGPQAGQSAATTQQLRQAAWEGLPHAPGAPSMVIDTLPDQTRFVHASDEVSRSARPEIQQLLSSVRRLPQVRLVEWLGSTLRSGVERVRDNQRSTLAEAQASAAQGTQESARGQKPTRPRRPGKPRVDSAGEPVKPRTTHKRRGPRKPVKPRKPTKPTPPRKPTKPTPPRKPTKPTQTRKPTPKPTQTRKPTHKPAQRKGLVDALSQDSKE